MSSLSKPLNLALSVTLVLLPSLAWYKFFQTWHQLRLQQQSEDLFLKKHNSVVMYFKDKGMSGWPPYPDRLKLSVDTYHIFFEPTLYFIQTAQKHIDIAVMNIQTKSIYTELIAALNRGVAVRMIFDYNCMKSVKMEQLYKAGAEVLYFVQQDVESIFHYKYAVKDYSHSENKGFAMCGSLNWTNSGVIQNYEDVVFSTAVPIVKALHKNFEEIWGFLQKENEANLILKATIDDML